MEKTMKIEGMMCSHCEAAVKKALEAVDGVASAEVSHTSGTAVVTLSKPVDNAVLKKAVEDKDYTVTISRNPFAPHQIRIHTGILAFFCGLSPHISRTLI